MFSVSHEGVRGKKGSEKSGAEVAGRVFREEGRRCAKALGGGKAWQAGAIERQPVACGWSLLKRKQCQNPPLEFIYIHFNLFSKQIKWE